jgi:hypothetical protein
MNAAFLFEMLSRLALAEDLKISGYRADQRQLFERAKMQLVMLSNQTSKTPH